MLGSFSTQGITLTKNPHYWPQGLPHVQTIRYVASDSASSSLALITSGQVQLGDRSIHGGGIDNWVKRNPAHNHVVRSEGGKWTITVNLMVLLQASDDAVEQDVLDVGDPEGSKYSMLEVRGSFAGTEVRRRSRWDERFAGHFE